MAAANLSIIRKTVKMDTHTTMDSVLYLGGLMILKRSRKNNTKICLFCMAGHLVFRIKGRIQPEGGG